jgi:hypothetical protein
LRKRGCKASRARIKGDVAGHIGGSNAQIAAVYGRWHAVRSVVTGDQKPRRPIFAKDVKSVRHLLFTYFV